MRIFVLTLINLIEISKQNPKRTIHIIHITRANDFYTTPTNVYKNPTFLIIGNFITATSPKSAYFQIKRNNYTLIHFLNNFINFFNLSNFFWHIWKIYWVRISGIRLLHVCVQATWNLVFKIWEIVEKIKTDVDRPFLVSKMKKSLILAKYTEIFVFIIKTESSPSTSVFIFSNISWILKTKFYIFWIQTCRKWTKLFTWTFYFSQVSYALKNFWDTFFQYIWNWTIGSFYV